MVLKTRERLSRRRNRHGKAEADGILSCSQPLSGHFQMPILEFQTDRRAVHRRADEPAVAEIQDHGLERLQIETELFVTRSCGRFRDQHKG